MASRPVRASLHVGAVVLLAGGVLLAAGGTGAAAASRPDSYGGDATASAFYYDANKRPQPTPVNDPFTANLPYASTSIDSSGEADGTAASAYPGQGFLGVPALICVFAAQLCEKVQPPDYPLIAAAQYPSKPDAKATVSGDTYKQGQLQVTAHQIVAHADPNLVEATAAGSGLGATGVMTAGNASAHSVQHFVGAVLTLSTESAIHDVDIAGTIHIDSIRSVATGQVDGAGVHVASATTTVSGATVAGHPVVIDDKGVHVEKNGDSGAVSNAVNAALAKLDGAGISVRQLGTTRQEKTGSVSASTGGVLVSFTHTVNAPSLPPLPNRVPAPPSPNGDYIGSITLAGAGVSAFATPATPNRPVNVPPAPVPSQAPPPAATGGGGGAAPPPAEAPPSSGSVQQQPPQQSAPAVAKPTAAAPPKLAGVDLTAGRMKWLAIVMLGYPLAIIVARGLRAPPRLPRIGRG